MAMSGTSRLSHDIGDKGEFGAALLASDSDVVDAVLELVPTALCVWDRDGLILRYNRAAAELWGRRPRPRDAADRFRAAYRLRELGGTELPPSATPVARAIARGAGVHDCAVVVERPDGTLVDVMVTVAPIKDAEGRVIGAVSHHRDISARRSAQNALADERKSAHARSRSLQVATGELERRRLAALLDHRLAAIVESSDDAIISKDLNGVIQTWNEGARRLFGYSADEAIGRPVLMLMPADRQDEEPMILARVARGERIEHYETVRRRKDGTLIEISLSVSPVRDGDGNIIAASKIARDITETRRAQRQRDLLLREMHHRVKNLFALASSVVSLSARAMQIQQSFAAPVVNRLHALARAHALSLPDLHSGAPAQENAAGLRALVETIVAPFVTHDLSRIVLDGPALTLGGSLFSIAALVLNEFATNSAKYGALSAPQGYIAISWQRDAGGLRVTWRETGFAPKHTGKRGFGDELTGTAVAAMGGSITRNFEPDGLAIVLAFPASRDLGDAAPS
jgi:PAS domain S-box-containing protein